MSIYDEMFPEMHLPEGDCIIELDETEAEVLQDAARERIVVRRRLGNSALPADKLVAGIVPGGRLNTTSDFGPSYFRDLLVEYVDRTDDIAQEWERLGEFESGFWRQENAFRAAEVYDSICASAILATMQG